MSDYKVPLDDLRFLMKDVFDLGSFWKTLNGISELDAETGDAIVEEAAKVCEQVLAPLNREADEQGCSWQDGAVTTPEGFREAYRTFCEGGWNGVGGPEEFGGMGMPKTLVSAIDEMVQGANMALGLAPMLTAGAALAVNAHASDEIKQQYLPKLYSGEWSGAMDLTEPHCGTDLGLIRSKAEPLGDGSYAVTGTKIFITWGEHDMADNIIHLVLAKLPDAPPGSRGISMFLVPKFLLDDNGEPRERNAVHCGSIEKKMGIKASATCVMNFDGAKGWLVGEPNKGLACMFTMMNYERLGVGIQGISAAEASYQTALAYAKERIQGRSPSGPESPDKPADSLMVHPDVRRMLMTMKAFNEGGRAFYMYIARWLDVAKYGSDPDERRRAEALAALLTPVSKAFMTDVALQTAITGQQVLGGHGYVREWGQEQHVRDIRITQIYEGTNGVQAMDLVGRKTVAVGGELLAHFVDDINAFIAANAELAGCQEFFTALSEAVAELQTTTDLLVEQAKNDVNTAGAAAVDYLDMFGYVAYAYMWSRMATTALRRDSDDLLARAKLATAQFYFAKLLPQINSLKLRIMSGSEATMAMPVELF